MNKIVGTIFSAISFGVAFAVVRYWITGESYGLLNEPFEMTMQKEADKMNAKLPKMVDEISRLENVTVGPGNKFNYNYTLLYGDMTAEMTAERNKVIQSDAFKVELRDSVCSKMPAFRRNGTLVTYHYRTAQGDNIANIQVPTNDCLK